MSFVGSNILAGASGQGGGGYEIERSLRFNSGDSAYLNRTPSSAGNRKTWTWSGWVKRAKLGTYQNIFGTNSPTGLYFQFVSDDTFQVMDYTSSTANYRLITNQVFRDVGAWMHILVALDTSLTTADDRIKLYVNGNQITSFSTRSNPSLNYEGVVNTATAHTLGRLDAQYYCDLYLADVHFIDGQALAPTDFGETDDNGVWQPKEFDGTYGPLVNQSQTWSSGKDGDRSDYPVTNVFDASLTTIGYGGVNQTITVTLPGGSIALTSLRVRAQRFGTATGKFYVNGTDYTSQIASGNNWNTITGETSITSIAYASDSGSNYVGLYAIEVNGKQLVDSGVTVADNSFHLPFTDNSSSAALGTDTSSNSNTWSVNNLSVAGSGWNQSQKWSNDMNAERLNKPYLAFDGDLSTYAHASASAGTMTWTPTGGHSYTNSVRVYAYANYGGANSNVSLNGGSAVVVGASNGWVTVATGSGTITSISNSYAHTYRGLIVAIEVDGKILVDSDIVDPLASGIDSLVDSPTNGTQPDTGAGNELSGNYATLNPLDQSPGTGVLSNGNLDYEYGSSALYAGVRGTIGVSSGKWYYECTINTINTGFTTCIGVATQGFNYLAGSNIALFGNETRYYLSDGQKSTSSGTQVTATYGASYTTGDVIGVTLDLDAGTITFYKNGVSQGQAYSGLSGTYFPALVTLTGGNLSTNFGQRAFAYPLSGYKSLNTANLPEPTIADGSQYFDTKLWTGNGSTQTISNYNFSPDFVWMKARTLGSANHGLFDVIRGVTKRLISNTSGGESTQSQTLTSFNSDGFDLGTDAAYNGNNYPIVGWAWDAGTVANPVGDIWSPGASKYIGIKFATASGGTVSYGQTSGTNTVQVWVSSDNSNWIQQGGTQTLSTGHTLTTSDQYVYIRNTSDATFANWYAAATNGADGHYSSATYPSGASWTGPAYTDHDFRDGGGSLIAAGGLNSSAYDQSQTWSSSTYFDDNGFGFYNSGGSAAQLFDNVESGSGSTGDYPLPTNGGTFKLTFTQFSSATTVSVKYAGSGNALKINGSFVTLPSTSGTATYSVSGLTTIEWLYNGSAYCYLGSVTVDGVKLVDPGVSVTDVPSIASTVRANPSAGFSIVTYEGNGVQNKTIGHGLNSEPKMILVKRTSAATSWAVYHSSLGGTKDLALDTTAAAVTRGDRWANTNPTSSVFYVGNSSTVNGNGSDYVAYCFAPVEGYSAMGSYTGNGSADGPFVFTGFKPAWILIKETSASGNNWNMWDTERNSFNVLDKQLKASSSGAEVTNTFADSLSNGFKIRGSSGGLNGNSKTHIFIAFASHPFKTARAR